MHCLTSWKKYQFRVQIYHHTWGKITTCNLYSFRNELKNKREGVLLVYYVKIIFTGFLITWVLRRTIQESFYCHICPAINLVLNTSQSHQMGSDIAIRAFTLLTRWWGGSRNTSGTQLLARPVVEPRWLEQHLALTCRVRDLAV